jgi:hypothetical protein
MAKLVKLLTPRKPWAQIFLDFLGMAGNESERAYEVELRRRPQLNDDDFYERFYAGSDVPKDIPIRLRQVYEKAMGDDVSGLHPQDNFAAIYDGLDFSVILCRVEREFNLKIPLAAVVKAPLKYRGKSSSTGDIDGTFDSVVRYLAKATRSE